MGRTCLVCKKFRFITSTDDTHSAINCVDNYYKNIVMESEERVRYMIKEAGGCDGYEAS